MTPARDVLLEHSSLLDRDRKSRMRDRIAPRLRCALLLAIPIFSGCYGRIDTREDAATASTCKTGHDRREPAGKLRSLVAANDGFVAVSTPVAQSCPRSSVTESAARRGCDGPLLRRPRTSRGRRLRPRSRHDRRGRQEHGRDALRASVTRRLGRKRCAQFRAGLSIPFSRNHSIARRTLSSIGRVGMPSSRFAFAFEKCAVRIAYFAALYVAGGSLCET